LFNWLETSDDQREKEEIVENNTTAAAAAQKRAPEAIESEEVDERGLNQTHILTYTALSSQQQKLNHVFKNPVTGIHRSL
jgi:hypothetical protein